MAGDSCASTQNLKQPADQPESDLLSFGDDLYLRRDPLDQALLTSINRLNSNFQNFAQQFETVMPMNIFDNPN